MAPTHYVIPGNPQFTQRVVSDVSGQDPLYYGPNGPYPGVIRSLLPVEVSAMASYAVLSATNSLCWQMLGHSAELEPQSCLLVARVLFAATKAIDQVRSAIKMVDISIQLRFANISIVAKDLARNLRRASITNTGTTAAIIPQASLNTLIQIEALDTMMPLDASNPTLLNLSYLAAIILDTLTFVTSQ